MMIMVDVIKIVIIIKTEIKHLYILYIYIIFHQISLFSPVQQKQVEIERVQKWLKMLKNWNKYRNSDRVSFKYRGCNHSSENNDILFILYKFDPLTLNLPVTENF